jgi:hypothetical protein
MTGTIFDMPARSIISRTCFACIPGPIRPGMAKHCLVLILCACMAGCIIVKPYRFKPLRAFGGWKQPPGSYIPTTLTDAATGEQIHDARIVIVIARGPAYIPDSQQGPSLSPRIEIADFADLPGLSYPYSETYLWLFAAFGSLYSPSGMYVFRPGYRPVDYEPDSSGVYPALVEMDRTDEASGRAELIDLAVSKIEDKWKPYLRRQLTARLAKCR